MIKTVTRPHEDPRTPDPEKPWALVVRRGGLVDVYRFQTKSKALVVLGEFIGKGYDVI